MGVFAKAKLAMKLISSSLSFRENVVQYCNWGKVKKTKRGETIGKAPLYLWAP